MFGFHFLLSSKDEAFIKEVATKLEKLGHNPKVVHDLKTATELHESQQFEVIYIDDSFNNQDCKMFLHKMKNDLRAGKENLFLGSSDFKGFFRSLLNETNVEQIKAVFLPTESDRLVEIFEKYFESLGVKGGQKNKYNIDTDFMKIFVESSIDVLKQWLQDSNIKTLAPFLAGQSDLGISIRGKIKIESPYFLGSFYVSFPEESYKKIYQMVTGEELKAISAESADFASEIVNNIYGHSKKVLNTQGYGLGMAFPSWNQSPQIKTDKDIIVIPLNTTSGKIFLKIAPGNT